MENTHIFKVSVDLTRRVDFTIEAKDQSEARDAAQQFIDTLNLYDNKEIVSINVIKNEEVDNHA